MRQKLSRPTWKALSNTVEYLAGSLQRHGDFLQVHGSSIPDPRADLGPDGEIVPVQFWSSNARIWDEYLYDVNKYRDKFEEEEKARKIEVKRSVLTWVSASKKTPSLHKEFQGTRAICGNTGRWLFKRYSEITDWMKDDQPPESAIWLHGTRGFGNDNLINDMMLPETLC